jgi:sec-independent protein translocase protein TatA
MAMLLGFFPSIGVPELVVIGLVAVILFGKRLPEVGRSLGKGVMQFKKGLKDVASDIEKDDEDDGAAETDKPSEDRPQGTDQ